MSDILGILFCIAAGAVMLGFIVVVGCGVAWLIADTISDIRGGKR